MQSSELPSQVIASSGLRQIVRRHPLPAFFIMAYGFSWIAWLPFVLAVWHIIPSNSFSALTFPIGTFLGPTLSAFLVTGVTEGDIGLGRLLHRFALWRVGLQWYLFVLLAVPVLCLLGIVLLPGSLASFKPPPPGFVVQSLEQFFIVFFLGGPLAEEPGWRGFALPRLQTGLGPLRGTLVLAVLWACWHLPHFLTPAQHGGPGTHLGAFLKNFPAFVLLCVALAILLTWVFNCTRGSLLLVILLHASVDATLLPSLFPTSLVTSTNLFPLIGFGVPALLIVLLTRGRLGYPATLAVEHREGWEPQT
jgi:membrane protease YdiL (CAAX protease family)